MAAEIIGRATCFNPKCRSKKARVSLAKSGLPVMTCNACNLQVFARGDLSDEGIRSVLLADDPLLTADDRTAAAPAAVTVAAPAGQALPHPAHIADVSQRPAWGLSSW